jgi:hypothetical protein
VELVARKEISMARRKRRTKRSGYQRLVKKGAKCPGTVKRECKITKKGGQRCRVVAGRYKSKFYPAGQALRSMLKLKTRLGKKGCATGLSTSLGRYRRRRR